MKGLIVFDMDGTIADLYGVSNWLEDLRNFNPRPYIVAKPLVDMNILISVLYMLKEQGYKIAITSWLSKETTADYDKAVRQAKREWLIHNKFPFDELHFVKYGARKANSTRKYKVPQILVDDNADVRKSWTLGDTIDAKNDDIIEKLVELLVTT